MASQRVRACLITNPRSGRGGIDLSPVLPILAAHNWDVVVQHKLHGGMATDLARQAARDGYHIVIDCGGDGTLNEIVDGLVGTSVAVGALPGGTVNEWTRELGISPHLDIAARQLVGSVRRTVDVGRLTINGKHVHHFLLMAGLGFDGAVMAHVSKPLKNRIGPLAVGLATLQTLPSFDAVPVEIAMDAVHWQGKAAQIIVGNTRRYGGFAAFTPDAYVDDGLLDLCLFTATSIPALMGQATTNLLRRQPDLVNREQFRSGRIAVRAPHPMPVQLDGGAVHTDDDAPPEGMTYTFAPVAQALTVLVPAMYTGALFQHPAGALPAPLASHNGRGTHLRHANRDGKAHKDEKRDMRVIAVGVNTITAARLGDGLVFAVATTPQTTARDHNGSPLPLHALLSQLQVGDCIHVKGPKDRERGTISAHRITRRARTE